MSRDINSEADRAVWLVHVVEHTAEELNLSVSETVRLLENDGHA